MISPKRRIRTHLANSPTYQLQWKSIGTNSNISGFCHSGELFAFLGTANTKSNILQTIYKSNPETFDNKLLYLNGQKMTSIPHNFSYLDHSQSNNMYDNLSVLETLIFSAGLRIASPIHLPELTALRMLTEVGLEDIADLKVLELSLWQKRILILATEVVANRNVLFYDKPTLDLDASSALLLTTALQRVARGNRIVVITIGNLTFREYAMLDRIQLVSTNGAIYFGPSAGVVSYFESLGRTPSPGASISDFLLDLVDDISPRQAEMTQLEKLAERAGSACPPFQSSCSSGEANSNINIRGTKPGQHFPNCYTGRLNSNDLFDCESPVTETTIDHENEQRELYMKIDSTTTSIDKFQEFVDSAVTLCTWRYWSSVSSWLCNFECFDTREDDWPTQPLILKQLNWCIWRAFTVRLRDRVQLIYAWFYKSFLLYGLFALIFVSAGLGFDRSYEDLITFLTIVPFSVMLTCALWTDNDKLDRKIFGFERDRGYYQSIFFPCASLLADVLVFKIFPPIIASVLLYWTVALTHNMAAFVTYVEIMILLCTAAACLCKAVLSCLAWLPLHSTVHSTTVLVLLLCLNLIYCGPWLDCSKLTGVAYQIKQASFMHWGTHVIYWSELAGKKLCVAELCDGVGLSGVNYKSGEELLLSHHIMPVEPGHAIKMLWLHICFMIGIYVIVTVVAPYDWLHTNS